MLGKRIFGIAVIITGCYFVTQYSTINVDPAFNGKSTTADWVYNSSKRQPVLSIDFELNGTASFPWQSDPKCSGFSTRFGHNLSTTFLISYPRSGNTWLRYLIEGATGVFTSSVYRDKRLYKIGFLGELEPVGNGKTIVSKDHRKSLHNSVKRKSHERNANIPQENPVILLIRNPFKSIISYWNFLGGLKSKDATFFKSVNKSTYQTKYFQKFVNESLTNWKSLNSEILTSDQNLLVLFYEDLKANFTKELKKVLNFLQVPIVKERLECLVRHSEGPFQRNSNEVFNPFTEMEQIQIAQDLTEILSLAERKGFKPTSNSTTLI